MRAVAALLLFCVLLVWASGAHAATVAILSSGSSPALSEANNRLRGELAALRFDVLVLRRPTTAELGAASVREWLERMAETRDIDAVIDVIDELAPRAVDVWIFGHSPRRSQVTRVLVALDTPDRAGTFAIRAIEVLRSYDLEADLAAKARVRDDDAVVPSPDGVPAETSGAARSAAGEPVSGHAGRFGFELGASILVGLDRVGPALLPVLRFDWRARPSWLVHATVSGFGTRPVLRAPAGTVRVGQSYGALGLCWCPASGQLFSPYLALAAGLAHTSLTGAAESPARGHAVEHWSGLLDAGVGARLRLVGRYYATLSGHVQVMQPRVAIHVVDEQVAGTGRPNLVASVMIGAWL
jgi:hypothetical protein